VVFSIWSSPELYTHFEQELVIDGGYKYGNLVLQVGGVSDETEKYSREFCGTSAYE
jgi:hypothetical protein